MKLVVSISIKWWVVPYLTSLRIFCQTFGSEPNYEVIGNFVANHGIKISKPFSSK
jgi:hypothetical protein